MLVGVLSLRPKRLPYHPFLETRMYSKCDRYPFFDPMGNGWGMLVDHALPDVANPFELRLGILTGYPVSTM